MLDRRTAHASTPATSWRWTRAPPPPAHRVRRRRTPVASARREFAQHYPQPGWVEHDPEDIWQRPPPAREAIAAAGAPIRAIGIANQRETAVLWDRRTGEPVHPAIVWQDRRTAAACAALQRHRRRRAGARPHRAAAGPVFLRHQARLAAGRAARRPRPGRAGPTGVRHHRQLPAVAADRRRAPTRRTRPMPAAPCCSTSTGNAGTRSCCGCSASPPPCCRRCATAPGSSATTSLLGGSIPVAGMAGDQQAALVGQACFAPGMVKSTYGTGCFALLNTGAAAGALRQRPADHGRLPPGRPGQLRAGGVDLRRRRRGEVAARRGGPDHPCVRDRRPGDAGRRQPRRLHGARLRRPGRAALGRRTPAA